MPRLADQEVGYSIKLPGGAGDIATLGTLLDLFQNTAGEFAIIFDAKFADENYNAFFGGSQGSSSLKIIRNKVAGNIDFEVIDEGALTRAYTYTAPLKRGDWYNFIINGTANGASGIAFYLDFVSKSISAQTNDAAFDPTVTMSLKFGDVDGVNLGGVLVTKFYFGARKLTDNEILDIKTYRKYPSDFIAYNFKRPNIGLNKGVVF